MLLVFSTFGTHKMICSIRDDGYFEPCIFMQSNTPVPKGFCVKSHALWGAGAFCTIGTCYFIYFGTYGYEIKKKNIWLLLFLWLEPNFITKTRTLLCEQIISVCNHRNCKLLNEKATVKAADIWKKNVSQFF